MNKELWGYIKQALKEGKTPEDIQNEMLSSGYGLEQIRASLEEFFNIENYKKHKYKIIIWVSVVIFAVIIIAVGNFFLFYNLNQSGDNSESSVNSASSQDKEQHKNVKQNLDKAGSEFTSSYCDSQKSEQYKQKCLIGINADKNNKDYCNSPDLNGLETQYNAEKEYNIKMQDYCWIYMTRALNEDLCINIQNSTTKQLCEDET